MEQESRPNILPSKRRWDAMSMNGDQVKMERKIKRQRLDDSFRVNTPCSLNGNIPSSSSSTSSTLESTVPPDAMQMVFMWFDEIGKRENGSKTVDEDEGRTQLMDQQVNVR